MEGAGNIEMILRNWKYTQEPGNHIVAINNAQIKSLVTPQRDRKANLKKHPMAKFR